MTGTWHDDVAMRPRLPRWVLWVLVPLAYYVGALLGVWATAMPEGISILWPPNAVLLAAMLLSRGRDVLIVALLGIGAEVVADFSIFTLPEALIFGVANAFEAWLASTLLKAWRFDVHFGSLADLRKFIVAGPLVAALASAALGALVYRYARGGTSGYLEYVRTWWLGDAMGLMIFTPLLLAFAAARPSWPRSLRVGSLSAIDAAVLGAAALIAVALVMPEWPRQLSITVAPVLLTPCVVYVAVRFDLRVVSLFLATVCTLVAFATSHDLAPFGHLPAWEASMRAQEFLLATSLLALGLASLLQQLRNRQRELSAANEQLDRANRDLELRVAERTAELDARNRELQQLALTDPLTGVANRRAWFGAARAAMEAALRHQRSVGLVIMDIDRFKEINDRHGHAMGDLVLQHVATTLAAHVRSADVLARYGGEEFVLLAPESQVADLMTLVQRMRATLAERPVKRDGLILPVTLSYGIAVLEPSDNATLEFLLARADAALYEAKTGGRNRIVAAAAPAREAADRPQP